MTCYFTPQHCLFNEKAELETQGDKHRNSYKEIMEHHDRKPINFDHSHHQYRNRKQKELNHSYWYAPTTKEAFRRKGKIYVLHQDWYRGYRRRRGPYSVVRGLTLRNPHRKKPVAKIPLADDGNVEEDIKDEDSNDGEGDYEGNSRGNNIKGNSNNDINNISSNGSDINNSSNNHSKKSSKDKGIQSLEPEQRASSKPSNIRHTGLIPKARSEAAQGQGRSNYWSKVWMRSLVLIVALTVTRMKVP